MPIFPEIHVNGFLSLIGTLLVFRKTIEYYLPPEIATFLRLITNKISSILNLRNKIFVIQEIENDYHNPLFSHVEHYVGAHCIAGANSIRLLLPSHHSTEVSPRVDLAQSVDDVFEGIKVSWMLHKRSTKKMKEERNFYTLCVRKKYADTIQNLYIPKVIKEAEAISRRSKQRRLYTNKPGTDVDSVYWFSVPLKHPATFDTLALDSKLKGEIMEDLNQFVNGQSEYERLGRTWKRGYLLYGPPGTGKTSLVAAIANYLGFDIYDLELSCITDNSQLRKLMMSTAKKSVIVIEDADCTPVDMLNREQKKETEEEKAVSKKKPARVISLSGILNFIDGLWSAVAGEKLIILTTNRREQLDKALLRPGRMDKHILLSYCGGEALKILVKNYLKVEVDGDECVKGLVEEMVELLPGAKLTPAEIAETFLECGREARLSLGKLCRVIKSKAAGSEVEDQANDGEEKVEQEISKEI